MLSSLHRRFAWAVLSSLLRGRLFFRGGHLPPSGHSVGEAFFGVGVAAAQDAAIDDYIVESLKELGLNHVRIDVTPGNEDGPPCRLLDRLCDEAFKVTLHLIQPRDEAKRMPSPEAGAAWQRFVAGMMDRYAARIEMVEIGSTVNRKRWAGYSLAGFLSMWEIAWREVRTRGLTLAGPSVTDFEPPWNIGLLQLLQDRGQLPDVHTDNLFSERCSEPERFDHKIMGPAYASWHKYNLIKKARLLARIGVEYAVPRLASPAAFWTLPRIERMYPDSEQKQADYLVRYLVLAAASGALERTWWGPLICHREGLIDNGTRAYPATERITHYASVEGERGDLRKRPAFFALRQLVPLLREANYEGSPVHIHGLEIHTFVRRAERTHIVWTINGKAASLRDLYAADDLAAATILDRDSNVLEQPASPLSLLASESPVVLQWPVDRPVRLKQGAALLRDVCIARHTTKQCYFHYRDPVWQGIVLARDSREALALLETIHPDHIDPPSREATLRYARNAIWTIGDPRAPDRKLVVKKPVKMHLHKRFLDRFKPSKALRSWNGSCELLCRGVAAATPVAYFETHDRKSLSDNYYLCERVASDYTARDMIAAFSAGQPHFLDFSETDAYRQLGAFVLRMHGCGMQFRDLAGGNILIDRGDAGALSFALIDTGRLRTFDMPLTLYQRFADLVRICNKMNAEGRRTFLELYFRALHRQASWWHRLPFMLYDRKVELKRRVGRKAIKRLIARIKNSSSSRP